MKKFNIIIFLMVLVMAFMLPVAAVADSADVSPDQLPELATRPLTDIALSEFPARLKEPVGKTYPLYIGDKWGLVDSTGDYVYGPEFYDLSPIYPAFEANKYENYMSVANQSDIGYIVSLTTEDGIYYAMILSSDGKLLSKRAYSYYVWGNSGYSTGYTKREGEPTIAVDGDEVVFLNDTYDETYRYKGYFSSWNSNGMGLITSETNSFVVDKTGQLIKEFAFPVSWIDDNNYLFEFHEKKSRLLTLEGKTIFTVKGDYIYPAADTYSAYKNDRLLSYDKKGSRSYYLTFADKKYRLYSTENYKYKLTDSKKHVLLENLYSYATISENHMTFTQMETIGETYIDTTHVLNTETGKITTFDGRLSPYDFQGKSGILFAKNDGTYSLVDIDGKQINNKTYKNAYMMGSFDGSIYIAGSNQETEDTVANSIITRMSVFDIDGNKLIKGNYDYIESFDGTYALVSIGPFRGYVDKDGNWLVKRSMYDYDDNDTFNTDEDCAGC